MLFSYFDTFFLIAILLTRIHAAVDQCCRKHKIPEICVKTLCNPSSPPGDFDVYDIFERRNNCSKHLEKIAQCLADGRNHSYCCETEAKDREENACFGLCQGKGRDDVSWTGYQTCLAINLPSMFSCFQKGYNNIPSAPQMLTVVNSGKNPVQLSWSTPLINPDQAFYFEVVCVENDSYTAVNNKLTKTTRNMEITLDQLLPGTKYYCYSIALTRDGKHRSLPSDRVHFQTPGQASNITAYRTHVPAPRDSKVVLACYFNSSGQPDIKWQVKNDDSRFVNIEGHRFSKSHYLTKQRPQEYVSLLEIQRVQETDYSMYRCIISYEFGNNYDEIRLEKLDVSFPRSPPPETPRACCVQSNVEHQCLSMCGSSGNNETRRTPIMPHNCSSELFKVLACAMPNVDNSGCCLRERVPRVCMYLCDSSERPRNLLPHVCKEYLSKIEECRYGEASLRPLPPRDVKVQSTGGSQWQVSWKGSDNAHIYYVYWRKHRSSWEKKSIKTTSKTITNADEIVLVAANSHGLSQAVKYVLANSTWIQG